MVGVAVAMLDHVGRIHHLVEVVVIESVTWFHVSSVGRRPVARALRATVLGTF
jgi:hypothetical protein